MPVTREDVLHIAELARLGVDTARAEELTKELSAILAHMEVLSQVDTASVPTLECRASCRELWRPLLPRCATGFSWFRGSRPTRTPPRAELER